jgi:hypothetical protein
MKTSVQVRRILSRRGGLVKRKTQNSGKTREKRVKTACGPVFWWCDVVEAVPKLQFWGKQPSIRSLARLGRNDCTSRITGLPEPSTARSGGR